MWPVETIDARDLLKGKCSGCRKISPPPRPPIPMRFWLGQGIFLDSHSKQNEATPRTIHSPAPADTIGTPATTLDAGRPICINAFHGNAEYIPCLPFWCLGLCLFTCQPCALPGFLFVCSHEVVRARPVGCRNGSMFDTWDRLTTVSRLWQFAQ